MNFIPEFHFDNPDSKMSPEWCKKVVDYYYYNTNNVNLLAGKNIKDIEGYANGDFSMIPFKMKFSSLKKKVLANRRNPDGTLSDFMDNGIEVDTIGIDWEQLALITSVLNSAIESVMRTPKDVSCTAADPLAMQKKNEDLEFLKNKPLIESDLQELSDQMQLGKVQLGNTKHSSTKFSDSPMGLDLNNPDHEEVFMKLFYALKIESAFEKFLKKWGSIKNIDMILRLMVADHFKFGVAVVSDYVSSMTGMPDIEYVHPSRVYTPISNLPDYSDRTHEIIDFNMTVMEMFNHFSDEICDKEKLNEIINGDKGYCKCNNKSAINTKDWGTSKINLKLIAVKSIDWVGVAYKKKSKRKVKYLTLDENECDYKLWGQNTYLFFWVTNTDYCFHIEKLPFSYRTKGQESFQNFPTHIYRSQKRSAVELCIGENKMAQIAYIKLQHAIIKSAPNGKYFDLRFMRNALLGLKEEKTQWTQQDLINLFIEHNIMIGDTEGFDGKNDGQIKPYMEIPGGLRAEVEGYWKTIENCRRNVGIITGINQQMTGQSPEELIGLQQLQINSAMNAINYCNIAIQEQLSAINNNWACYLQSAIEAGGKTKEAVIKSIGEDDTELLDDLDDAPLHNLTIRVDIGQQQNQLLVYERQLAFLKSKNVVNTADEYLLSAIDNPKERFQKLYFVEEKWKKEQDDIRQQMYESQQQLVAKQGENLVQKEQAKGQQDVNLEYVKGEVQGKIMQLAQQLGLSSQQTDAMIKLALQKDRNIAQKDKLISSLREKANLKQQEAA